MIVAAGDDYGAFNAAIRRVLIASFFFPRECRKWEGVLLSEYVFAREYACLRARVTERVILLIHSCVSYGT